MTAEPAVSFDQQLVSRDFIRDPYPTLQVLRDEHPVVWSDSIGAWVVTRYSDVVETLKVTSAYSNEGRLGKASDYLSDEDKKQLEAFRAHYRTKGLLHSDPPDHTRLRKAVLRAFSPRVINGLRPRIQEIVDGLLDAGLRDGGMEVIEDLAVGLPVAVLADILGVPASDRALFRTWADRLLAFQGVNKPPLGILLEAQATLIEMRAYISDAMDRKTAEPGSDLISGLLHPGDPSEEMSADELISTCVTFLVAGHETTTSLIGNGLFLLLSEPGVWASLRDDRSMLGTAVEETLRVESPVARQTRVVTQDIELGGNALRPGDMVMQMLNSANRDPRQFEDPERFDPARHPNRHIAFGQGIHFCVGAPLSRLEGDVVFTTLLERVPSLRLVDPEPRWDLAKANSRVLTALPVAF